MTETTLQANAPCGLFKRLVCSLVLVTYTTVFVVPDVGATEAAPAIPASPPVETPPSLEPVPAAAEGTKDADTQAAVFARLAERIQTVDSKRVLKQDLREDRQALREIREQLAKFQAEDRKNFDQIGLELEQKKLPEVILKRHRESVQKYEELATSVHNDIESLERATDPKELETRTHALQKRLQQITTGRPHQQFDPNNLPFRKPTGDRLAPKTKAAEFADLMSVEPRRGVLLAARSPLDLFLGAQATPVPFAEYLAETEDVRLTDEVRAQAEALDSNPVQIFNWVRNNIVYLPTQGSIQGSQITMQTGQGNAIDTSSLLIALLRAAGIPSRYVHGTIEVPIAQVMNWVGGMTSPNAALDFLAQGGVPVTGLAQGGVIRVARIQHTWVEAYVDFNPSRGARNLVGDNWIPLDASFKQYENIEGLISNEMTQEIQAAAQAYVQSAQVGAGGSMTGFDTTAFDAILAQTREQVAAIAQANPTRFTMEDYVGGRKIIQTAAPTLSASLPYRVLVRGAIGASLPESLRVAANIEIFAKGAYGEDGALLLNARVPLTTLGYGSLHLSHVPATANDAAVWDSYKTVGASTLPAYLIRVNARLTLDGEVLAQSPAIGLGTDMNLRVTFTGASGAQVKSAQFAIISGDDVQIGINGAGQVPEQGLALRNRDFGTSEGNLYVVNKTFWTQADYHQRILAQTNRAAIARLPSVGIFASPISIVYSFGVPRNASYHSRQVDVKLAQISAISLDGNEAQTRKFVLQTGMALSSLEGAVIEEVFRKPLGHGSNTMRLLELANQQNIPIYRVNAANLNALRGSLQHSADVFGDISNAVNAGLEVIIPQRQQTNGAWSGSGYIMLDPQTGSADYRVSGGLSGNFDDEACQRQVEPVKVKVPDIAFIWWLLFGYLIDEDYNFNGAGAAAVVIGVLATAAILAIVAGPAAAALAAGAQVVGAAARAAIMATIFFFSGAALAGVEDDCSCTPERRGSRRGGIFGFYTAVHNACANVYTDPDLVNSDVDLRDKSFDGWRRAENTLYEIKTGTFYSTVKSLSVFLPAKEKLLETLKTKALAEYAYDRIVSGVCGFEFGFGVRDPALMLDMKTFFNEVGLEGDALRVFPNGC